MFQRPSLWILQSWGKKHPYNFSSIDKANFVVLDLVLLINMPEPPHLCKSEPCPVCGRMRPDFSSSQGASDFLSALSSGGGGRDRDRLFNLGQNMSESKFFGKSPPAPYHSTISNRPTSDSKEPCLKKVKAASSRDVVDLTWSPLIPSHNKIFEARLKHWRKCRLPFCPLKPREGESSQPPAAWKGFHFNVTQGLYVAEVTPPQWNSEEKIELGSYKSRADAAMSFDVAAHYVGGHPDDYNFGSPRCAVNPFPTNLCWERPQDRRAIKKFIRKEANAVVEKYSIKQTCEDPLEANCLLLETLGVWLCAEDSLKRIWEKHHHARFENCWVTETRARPNFKKICRLLSYEHIFGTNFYVGETSIFLPQ